MRLNILFMLFWILSPLAAHSATFTVTEQSCGGGAGTLSQAGIRYEFGLAGGSMMIGTNVAYRSEMYTNSPIDLTNPFMLNAESESRSIWNANIVYTSESGHWRIALEGKNLNDERSLVNTFNVTNFITGGYTRGRTWGLSVRYDI